MDGSSGIIRAYDSEPWPSQIVAPPFVAPEILEQVDLPTTRRQLVAIVETEILPRLIEMHAGRAEATKTEVLRLTEQDIKDLAVLVLDPDIHLSSDFIMSLKDRGFSSEELFVGLLEPTARCLGTMWDNDECSFIDVTLGVGRLQQLLAMFNCSYDVPAFSEKRRVCMVAVADEQHSFGVSMVEKFLRAGGWSVRSERGTTLPQIALLMKREWFSVVGLTASSDRHLEGVAAMIREIRLHSRNPAVGIMVGGPPFTQRPDLATQVGADATAIDAPTAVLLAQRLFDIGACTNWRNSYE
jgi:methanogenic corrinoid protein MtbC1